MKKIVLSFILFASCLQAMEYRQAQSTDVPGILHLINTHAINDSDKVVILPEKFRESALKKSVEQGRMFVAVKKDAKEESKTNTRATDAANQSEQIVGYKKLFVLTDASEKQNILENELCFKSQPVVAGYVTGKNTFKAHDVQQPQDTHSVSVYIGADFTHPDYRGKGINKQLTSTALTLTKSAIEKALSTDKNIQYLSFVYGVTQVNAGTKPCDKTDRTLPIATSLRTLATELDKSMSNQNIVHLRYPAFMPTFDPQATECKPLPAEKSVPGFGCLLALNIASVK